MSPDGFAFPACNNNSCSAWASISTTKWLMNAAVWWDSIALLSGEGKIPSGAVGGAGLSKSPIALPEQISSKVPSIARKFAYCLPSSPSNSGVIFFGNGPYVFQPGIELSTFLRYTPLVSFSKEADSYLINVISISVGGVILPINGSMLKIHRDKASRSYVGGTRFSSSVPYTLLAPSIYGALISEFRKAAIAQGMKLVGPVSPFGLCFDASTMKSTRLGYNVPLIEIALKGEGKSKKETWQIYGANSVVRLSDQVYCLAFQTTDQYESRSIVIGTYQQKDAFFEFDLQADRLGFISSLLGLRTTCSNFKFV
ncbi:hypothetical protein KP509_15G064000 [Ceratopteris richardii]|uniref:Peptidase A1 domain-containing protein n=1 Tax=Ceratopteris richardii TaxID=49495 RepID=A0A8T2T8Q8_CERRI|nr:hypothetical protein KP509_15G064000 [Ceratopteris richardii]